MIREQQEDEIEMLTNKVAHLQFQVMNLPERLLNCHPQLITWSRISLKKTIDWKKLKNI